MADAVVTRPMVGRGRWERPNGVAVVDGAGGALTAWFLDGVSAELSARGYPVQRDRERDATDIVPNVRVVLNAVDAVVCGVSVLLIHHHTAFSAASPSNVPSRDAPMVCPSTWWYGTPVKR